jgi:hypothetical protein
VLQLAAQEPAQTGWALTTSSGHPVCVCHQVGVSPATGGAQRSRPLLPSQPPPAISRARSCGACRLSPAVMPPGGRYMLPKEAALCCCGCCCHAASTHACTWLGWGVGQTPPVAHENSPEAQDNKLLAQHPGDNMPRTLWRLRKHTAVRATCATHALNQQAPAPVLAAVIRLGHGRQGHPAASTPPPSLLLAPRHAVQPPQSEKAPHRQHGKQGMRTTAQPNWCARDCLPGKGKAQPAVWRLAYQP